MRARMECWILTSKNFAKLKQYYYLHAEFLEEVQYYKYKLQNQGFALTNGYFNIDSHAGTVNTWSEESRTKTTLMWVYIMHVTISTFW